MRLEYAIIGVMIFLVGGVLGLIAYDPDFVTQPKMSDIETEPKPTVSFQKEPQSEMMEKEIEIVEESMEEIEIQEEVIEETHVVIEKSPVPTIEKIPEPVIENIPPPIMAEPPPPEPPIKVEKEEPVRAQAEVTIPGRAMYPGCEDSRKCYVPSEVLITIGDTVLWQNDDVSAHTVTSGNPADGPDGIFDSGLFGADETFEFTFDESGEHRYYCTVHPWMTGTVYVK